MKSSLFYVVKEFKDTGIGKIPIEWDIARLEDLVYFKNGERPQALDYGNIPIYGANGIIGYTNKALSDNDFTLIIGRVGASGQIHLGSGEVWVSDNAIYSGKHEKSKVDLWYLFYLLTYKKLERFASKTTHPIITQSFLNKFLVPLPPLSEQQRIASILSAIDQAIQKTDEVIAKTERLKKGMMQELLTKGIGHKEFKDTEIGRVPKEWEIKKVSEVCNVVTGGTPDTKYSEYFGGNIKWLKSGDIKGLYIYDTSEKITQKGVENSNAKIHPPNGVAIALSGRGLTRGKTAIIKEPMACSQSVAIMLPNSELIPEFLHYNLANRYLEIRNLTGHFDRSGLNLSIVSNIEVPIPPFTEQQKIAKILSTIDKKLELERKGKEKLERIKEGFMNKLLTGKIRVKVEN